MKSELTVKERQVCGLKLNFHSFLLKLFINTDFAWKNCILLIRRKDEKSFWEGSFLRSFLKLLLYETMYSSEYMSMTGLTVKPTD